ncbi:MAG TPA: lipid A export permease/ATP-binding protein MsbA [Quisquiliibacterium sp.]|nr:lipid A export permease/ATP-binding protein MsbA [Quisquiliibacterium sp.]HPA89874.1 lipid A export permease/ATP-binding protein MsbA [Quisquiliibacterium sp.]HQN13386.1 lipid A export permease/ATP-binding protein MsbA [Quisquiliibacterium sp.]
MKHSLSIYRRLMGYTRPYLRGFGLALLGMVVAAATEPMFPALMKPLLDQGFVEKSGIQLWYVPAAIIGIFVVRGIATFTSNYALSWVANKVLADMRREMFAHMLRLPASDFEREASGLLISKIVFEVNNVTVAATRVLTTVVRDSLVIVGLLSWLLYLNWKLTMVALALIPVIAIVVAVFSKRMRSLNRQSLEHTGELTRVVEEAVHGYKVIKVFGAYGRESALFGRTVERLRGFAMRHAVASGATVPITQLCAAVAVAVVVSIALMQSLENQTTVGGFVSFVTGMLMLLAPLKHLADINGPLQRGLAAAESVFELLDHVAEADTGTRTLARADGALRFEAVAFRYPGAERDALAGIDLDIRAGELVALVGASGGGKTTLVNLVPRFFAPTHGRILLDGVPIADLTLASLRDQLALVSQDIVLFNDTVRANVAFGVSRAVTDEDIWRALSDAALDAHVRALPGGLDAPVGERGAKFSGGQRQRLAIARALLKNAPVLLLDEATSALDSQTERDVQMALERSMTGRTTLVIAHRLSTIERADRIVVLEGGRIVEQGRHDELLARGGIYAQLHRIQYASVGAGAD